MRIVDKMACYWQIFIETILYKPMTLFPPIDDDSIFFSMYDSESDWSRYAIKAFQLDDTQWQSLEHYYQAMKFDDASYRERIRLADTPQVAEKLGNVRFKKKRSDWKSVETTVMTRAIYTQCRTHEDMSASLLATSDENLIEDSQFDYFWGCGRDRRGENHFGKVLMNVRVKLQQEQSNSHN